MNMSIYGDIVCPIENMKDYFGCFLAYAMEFDEFAEAIEKRREGFDGSLLDDEDYDDLEDEDFDFDDESEDL